MRRIVTFAALALWATGAWAQDEDTARERGLLQGFIEDNLSGAGREVRIEGFEGALSSEASLDELTVADAEGVWLTLRDVTLVWTRSALLRGRLEVNRLTARDIILSRPPEAEDRLTPEDAQAQPFALPDLPVSVNIGELRAERVALGAPVLGEAAEFSVDGALSLDGGEGDADLQIERLDAEGELSLEAAYSNESRVLALDLDLREGPGGLLSGLMTLPDRPALGLRVTGEAPLDDFDARLTLTRNDVPRLIGRVRLQADPETGAQRFATTLGGDVRPFFTPELRGFFGQRTRLSLTGQTTPEGGTRIEALSLATEQLQVSGSLDLDPEGWPRRIALDGTLSAGGALIRLPMTGPPTRLRRAELSARFDASTGDDWQAAAILSDLRRGDVSVGVARLEGRGRIERAGAGHLTAALDFAVQGFDHASEPGLARAVGPRPRGRADLRWSAGAPLEIRALEVTSGDAALTASGEIDGLAEGFPVSGQARLRAGDLSRFSALAGRDLAGRVAARLSGSGTLLGGAFDVALEAETEGLAIGQDRLDPVLAPETELRATARRDETGTVLEGLTIANSAIEAEVSGRLDAQSGALDLEAALSDVALVEPRLSGRAELSGGLGWTAGGALVLEELVARVAGAEMRADGRISPEDPALPVEGRARLTAPDLSRLSQLAGRPLAGSVEVTAEGSGALKGESGRLVIDLAGRDLATGSAELDRLIAGRLSAGLEVLRENGRIVLRRLDMTSGQVRVTAGAEGPGAPIVLEGRLADLGLVAPGFSGPVEASGQVTLRDDLGRDLNVDLSATGPGGTTAQVNGNIADYGARVALQARGSLPLGLANAFIAPRSVSGVADYNLTVNGPPALSSVSGRIELSDGRLAMPTLNAAMDDLSGRIGLSGAQAQVNLSARDREAGTVRIRGPIGLTAPYPADLAVILDGVVHSDPDLYRTQIDGRLALRGPLTAGARIGGQLVLGETEIRVPSSPLADVGLLPQIRHLNAPPGVERTRRRAGLIREEETTEAGPGLGLDITISAPNRIFVRGRGLDAELGGSLRVQGTTSNVIPSGTFELQRGRLDILGQRLTLTEGVIDLRGAFDPYLRFVAETEAEDITVQVLIEGLASAPEITFTSVPELPQEEVVARLLFGRSMDNISPFQAAQLAAAVARLTGTLDGGLLSEVRGALGLSNLDVTTAADGTTEVSVGAYLSENVYSEVSADNEGEQRIDLNLDVSDRITVRGSLGTDGDTGIGVFFEKDY